jgi:ABC-2 type transport system permease protein
VIRPTNVLAVFRKDAVDAMRDARIVVSLIVPIALGLLYNSIFPEEGLVSVKLAYHADDSPAILEGIRAQAGTFADLRVRDVANEAEGRRLVDDGTVDVALIIPPGAEAAIRRGDTQGPAILLIAKRPPGSGESFVNGALERTLRDLAGQRPPAVVRTERVGSDVADIAQLGELGPRRFFVLATVVMLIAMIGMLAVPVILTEEMERKTLDALLLVVRQSEVIAAKSLVGLLYVAIGVPLMFVLTRLEIHDAPTLVLSTLLVATVLVALGLLIAGVFKNATRVYTWSSLFVLLAFGPAFAIGFPVPQWAELPLRATPTGAGMRLMTNGIAEHPPFGDSWFDYLVLVLWAIASFALLRWQLARREA